VRRRVVIVPLLLLAGVLLARRRQRVRAATTPLAAPPQRAPVALLEPGARFVSVAWTLVASNPAEPGLTISWAGDEHMELDRVDAQETPTQVFVTVLVRWSPPTGAGEGSAQTREHEAVVVLSGPLGTRELVHTPVDLAPLGKPAGDGPSAPPLYP